jgi:hypothetical protein
VWALPPPEPVSPLRPIVRPDAPRWLSTFATVTPRPGDTPVLALAALALVGVGVPLSLVTVASPPLGLLLLAVALAAGAALVVRARRATVDLGRISGEALSLLEDIDARFAYAERKVHEIPTGIRWRDVDPEVRTLLWDAAEHAVRVTALDAEIAELRYAAPGTPQAAYKATLDARRAEHLAAMGIAQQEAEALARVAGNAAAAARYALAQGASLEVVAPSPRVLIARGALAEARVRLQLLADAWGELDESTGLLQERLERPEA